MPARPFSSVLLLQLMEPATPEIMEVVEPAMEIMEEDMETMGAMQTDIDND